MFLSDKLPTFPDDSSDDDSTAQDEQQTDEQDLRELDLLAHVHQAHRDQVHPTQRSLAHALGLSLGMTNAILKRLVGKGFLMVRRINSTNVHYLVTPDGVEQLGHRSYLYLRRTVGHVVRYKERLRRAMHRFKSEGVRTIVLVGESDLEFLLEWCAQKEGLVYRHATDGGDDPHTVHTIHIVSEREAAPDPAAGERLSRLVRLADLLAPPVGDSDDRDHDR